MSIEYRGQLRGGHKGWITTLVCPQTLDSDIKVVSGSRDNTLAAWAENPGIDTADRPYVPLRRLEGHSGFLQDAALTNNGGYALSASWDRSIRLWNLKTGACLAKFLGHEKDVLSVAFSPDNRHVVSGSRDNKLKVWNVKGDCVFFLDWDAHTDCL